MCFFIKTLLFLVTNLIVTVVLYVAGSDCTSIIFRDAVTRPGDCPKYRSNYDEFANEEVAIYLCFLKILTGELHFKSTKNHPC